MVAFYQLTFYLSLALLAIVITIFVLAVSLLGRAVRISSEEQQKAERERQERNQAQLGIIQDEMDTAKVDDKRPAVENLAKSLRELEKQIKKHDRKLAWILWKPKFLTAMWGVFIPGSLFLFSAVLSLLALNFQTSYNLSLSLWILSLIATLSGITLICLILKVIEGVAVTADEASFIRQKEMLKTALIEFDKSNKPELGLKFSDKKTPFTIEAGSQKTLLFGISLTKGDIGRKPQVLFFAPKGFEFPGKTTVVQPSNVPNVAGLYTACIEGFKDYHRGLSEPGEIVIKAPLGKGTYALWYNIFCEQYTGPKVKFSIEVTGPL